MCYSAGIVRRSDEVQCCCMSQILIAQLLGSKTSKGSRFLSWFSWKCFIQWSVNKMQEFRDFFQTLVLWFWTLISVCHWTIFKLQVNNVKSWKSWIFFTPNPPKKPDMYSFQCAVEKFCQFEGKFQLASAVLSDRGPCSDSRVEQWLLGRAIQHRQHRPLKTTEKSNKPAVVDQWACDTMYSMRKSAALYQYKFRTCTHNGQTPLSKIGPQDI